MSTNKTFKISLRYDVNIKAKDEDEAIKKVSRIVKLPKEYVCDSFDIMDVDEI
jgi:hypothetical protein